MRVNGRRNYYPAPLQPQIAERGPVTSKSLMLKCQASGLRGTANGTINSRAMDSRATEKVGKIYVAGIFGA
jgi:hypothetical protein